MAKGVLFLTDSYHYTPSPNGLCIEKIAKNLVSDDVEVSVVSMRNQYIDSFEEIQGVSVYRVHSFPEWEVMYKRSPAIIRKIKGSFYKLKKASMISKHPLNSKLVLNDLVNMGEKVIKEKNIGIIVAVYRDAEDVFAALELKRRHPNVKLIVYTLDSISGGVCSNPFVSVDTHVKKCRELELRLLKNCDYFCPMKTHSNIFECAEFDSFRDKIVYMDVPSLIVDVQKSQNKYILNHDDLHFVFTGNMTKTNADSTYFIKLLPLLTKKINMHVDLYGGLSDDIKKVIIDLGIWDTVVKFHGNVTQEELSVVRDTADVFLNFGNEHPCGIPCKIFEYLSTGKPILSFYKIEEDASKQYLQDEHTALLISEKTDMEMAVNKIVNFVNGVEFCIVDAERILNKYRNNTPFPMVELIKKAL